MFLELTPIELNLYALVTLEVDIVVAKFTKTLFKATLWSYKAPIISMKLIDNKKDEEDKTPPDISPFTDGADTNRKKRVRNSFVWLFDVRSSLTWVNVLNVVTEHVESY